MALRMMFFLRSRKRLTLRLAKIVHTTVASLMLLEGFYDLLMSFMHKVKSCYREDSFWGQRHLQFPINWSPPIPTRASCRDTDTKGQCHWDDKTVENGPADMLCHYWIFVVLLFLIQRNNPFHCCNNQTIFRTATSKQWKYCLVIMSFCICWCYPTLVFWINMKEEREGQE